MAEFTKDIEISNLSDLLNLSTKLTVENSAKSVSDPKSSQKDRDWLKAVLTEITESNPNNFKNLFDRLKNHAKLSQEKLSQEFIEETIELLEVINDSCGPIEISAELYKKGGFQLLFDIFSCSDTNVKCACLVVFTTVFQNNLSLQETAYTEELLGKFIAIWDKYLTDEPAVSAAIITVISSLVTNIPKAVDYLCGVINEKNLFSKTLQSSSKCQLKCFTLLDNMRFTCPNTAASTINYLFLESILQIKLTSDIAESIIKLLRTLKESDLNIILTDTRINNESLQKIVNHLSQIKLDKKHKQHLKDISKRLSKILK